MSPSPSPYIVDPLSGVLVAPFQEPQYSQINLYNWDRANFATIDKNAAAAFKTLWADWSVGFIRQADILKTTDIPTVLKAYRTAPVPQSSHLVTLNPDYSVSITDGPPVCAQPDIPVPGKWEIGPDPANFEHSILVPVTAPDVQTTAGTSGLGAETKLASPQVSPDVAALMVLVQQLLAALAAKSAGTK